MGLKIPPSIWQSYINTLLDCLQSRKYCKALMNDLIYFTPTKKSYIAKLEDLLKALIKMDCKYHTQNVSFLEKNCNVWEIPYLLSIGGYMLNC